MHKAWWGSSPSLHSKTFYDGFLARLQALLTLLLVILVCWPQGPCSTYSTFHVIPFVSCQTAEPDLLANTLSCWIVISPLKIFPFPNDHSLISWFFIVSWHVLAYFFVLKIGSSLVVSCWSAFCVKHFGMPVMVCALTLCFTLHMNGFCLLFLDCMWGCLWMPGPACCCSTMTLEVVQLQRPNS